MIWRLTLRHLLSKPLSSFLTVVAISASISLLGIFWTIIENLEQVQVSQSSLPSNPSAMPAVTLFLDSKLPKNKVDTLRADILKQSHFRSADIIAPGDAIKLFEQQFGETLSKAFTEDTLPISMRLQFAQSSLDRNSYAQILNNLRSMEGVLDVDDGVSVLPTQQTSIKSRVFNWASALLVLVFLVVSLLISHLIRIAFETTRYEVETMKVLGAPFSWLFMPLLLEGLIFGISGTLAAIVLVSTTARVFIPRFGAFLLPKGMSFLSLSWSSTFQLIAVGLVASLVGAFMTWPLVKRPPSEV